MYVVKLIFLTYILILVINILVFNEAGQSVLVQGVTISKESATEVTDVHGVQLARCDTTLAIRGDAAQLFWKS